MKSDPTQTASAVRSGKRGRLLDSRQRSDHHLLRRTLGSRFPGTGPCKCPKRGQHLESVCTTIGPSHASPSYATALQPRGINACKSWSTTYSAIASCHWRDTHGRKFPPWLMQSFPFIQSESTSLLCGFRKYSSVCSQHDEISILSSQYANKTDLFSRPCPPHPPAPLSLPSRLSPSQTN